MRRSARFLVALVLGFATGASAAVVERLSPTVTLTGSPVPVLSMNGTMSATFMPALKGVMNAPSLSAPSPVIFPVLPSPAVAAQSFIAPAQPIVLLSQSGSGTANRERGPPTARDQGFGAHVAKSVADAARDWAVPADEIFEDHDALLVGENHQSLASVNELALALPRLAKSGVAVLGIEGLKRPNQAAVDEYVSGRTQTLPAEVLAFSPHRRGAFEHLLKAARAARVRVVALGVPLDTWARQAAELAAKKTGDPVDSFVASPGDQLYRAQTGYEAGYNEAVAEVYLTRRNQSMASFLVEAMFKGAKAVVLVGQNHVEGPDRLALRLLDDPRRWGNMSQELARLGLKAFSLTLTGGRYVDADSAKDDRDVRRASYAQAAKVSPNGAPAFARTGSSTGLYHAGGTVPGSMVAH